MESGCVEMGAVLGLLIDHITILAPDLPKDIRAGPSY